MQQLKSWQEHQGAVIDTINGYDVIDCRGCGFKHIVPIPDVSELTDIYKHEYYTKEKPLYLERHREDREWWDMTYGERYDTFEELLAPDRRRILDIGSGPGFFLLHGKERGWQTTGIEPSAQAASHSRELGLEIINDFLTAETAPRLGVFDVVHMSEVLEHIPEPGNLLKLARGLLADAGLICILVPNDYNPFQQALRTACGFEPWWVAPPHHINYFDFDSLGKLLEANGFEIVQKEATFPIDMFLLMGDNYVGDDQMGRLCHGKRQAFERNLAKAGQGRFKRDLYEALASVGIGRQAQIMGRKK